MKTYFWFFIILFSWSVQASTDYAEVVAGESSSQPAQAAAADNNIVKANMCLMDGGTAQTCASVAILSTDAMNEQAKRIHLAAAGGFLSCVSLYCPKDPEHFLYDRCRISCEKLNRR